MEHQARIERINTICKYCELDFEVLVNKKKKLLLGGSFDSIYYFEFFILFTGVETKENLMEVEPRAFKLRFLSLENMGFDHEKKCWQTKLKYSMCEPNEIYPHKKIYFYAPKNPLYTGMGIDKNNVEKYQLMDLTEIVNECLKLTDEYPLNFEN